MRKLVLALSYAIFIFGFAGWVYIAMNAVFHPETLALPLTHLQSSWSVQVQSCAVRTHTHLRVTCAMCS